jgi:UDP-GlcNAc:undecaprenyl-phosphate GlcNAc-1-phosphate transferase
VSFAWVFFALISLIATLSATEMVRLFAHRLSAVDRPGGRRVHRRPTARLGGLGIFWGFTIALAVATYGHPWLSAAFHHGDFGLFGMLAGSSLLLVVGMVDDVHHLQAITKLGFQTLAALLLYACGWRVETVALPGFGAWPVGELSMALTILWVWLITNALNLIDGLDGLACGVGLVATLAIGLLVAPFEGPLVIVAAALAGALIGFLWYNMSPALIFMGDAGSLFVGFALSALTLRASQLISIEAFPIVPMVLLFVPLFDTWDAIRRRTLPALAKSSSATQFIRGVKQRVFTADSLHLHHRLIHAGYSTRRAVAILWCTAALFAGAGCLLVHDRVVGYAALAALAPLAWWGLRAVRARVAGSLPIRLSLSLPPILAPAESCESDPSQRAA